MGNTSRYTGRNGISHLLMLEDSYEERPRRTKIDVELLTGVKYFVTQ